MMENTKLFIMLLVGIAVGSAGLYGAAITGYIPRIAEDSELRAAGLIGADLSEHVRAAKDVPAVARMAILTNELKKEVLKMQAEGILGPNDKLFVMYGARLDTSAGLEGTQMMILGVIRDGVFNIALSEQLGARLNANALLGDKALVVSVARAHEILSINAASEACEALTESDALLSLISASSEEFALLGIDTVSPLGVPIGENPY